MQDLDALKYFLINLGIHNLVLVVCAMGLGLLLGKLMWVRSKQGLDQLREALAKEGQKAKEARHERQQVEKASGVLRQELYGMRNQLGIYEKRGHLEKDLHEALHDAEERVVRLEGMVAKSERSDSTREAVEALAEERDHLREAVAEWRGKFEALEAAGRAGLPGADDFLRMKGVGAILVKRLHEAGITSYRQIAEWSDAEVERVSKELSLGHRVERDDWRGQAEALHCEWHGTEG